MGTSYYKVSTHSYFTYKSGLSEKRHRTFLLFIHFAHTIFGSMLVEYTVRYFLA